MIFTPWPNQEQQESQTPKRQRRYGPDEHSSSDGDEFQLNKRPANLSSRAAIDDRRAASSNRTARDIEISHGPDEQPNSVEVGCISSHPAEGVSDASRGYASTTRQSQEQPVTSTGRPAMRSQNTRHLDRLHPSPGADEHVPRQVRNSIALRSREPQTRTRWTEKDDRELIRLLAAHRASWTLVEQHAKFEVPRGQVAIRDRARNIKVQILQRDRVLPGGFDLVVLGKKEIAAVMKFNKNPYRSEVDIDAIGNPTRTNYFDI